MSTQQLTHLHGAVRGNERLFIISFRHFMKHNCSRFYSVETAAQHQQISDNADQAALLKNYVNPLRKPDYFQINNLFTIKDLFDAGVHLGHREDTLNENMRSYIFGSRLGHLIFDLPTTAEHLRRALNFASHIAYRGGIILFVGQYHQHCTLVEKTAIDCGEFAHTRSFRGGLFTNSTQLFRSTIRLPDLLIFLSTLDTILNSHSLVYESAKLNIPTIGIVDSNSDPTIITYPVPGNDDTTSSVELYCKLFKTAILKGKEIRKKEFEIFNVSNQ